MRKRKRTRYILFLLADWRGGPGPIADCEKIVTNDVILLGTTTSTPSTVVCTRVVPRRALVWEIQRHRVAAVVRVLEREVKHGRGESGDARGMCIAQEGFEAS